MGYYCTSFYTGDSNCLSGRSTSFHSGSYLIFHLVNGEVNNRNTAFMSQSYPPGMCACVYVTVQCRDLPDDVTLCCGKSWAWFSAALQSHFFTSGRSYPCGKSWLPYAHSRWWVSLAVLHGLRMWFSTNFDHFKAIPYNFHLFFQYLLNLIGIMDRFCQRL